MSKQSIRREKIALLLMKSTTPVPGKDLSRVFGVSRQVIVSDIAALKTEGHDIISAHNGYILGNAHRAERVFKIRHTSAETEDELTTIVSLGGVVVDVYVWHRVYGRITANLSIATMEDVTTFIENIKKAQRHFFIIEK